MPAVLLLVCVKWIGNSARTFWLMVEKPKNQNPQKQMQHNVVFFREKYIYIYLQSRFLFWGDLRLLDTLVNIQKTNDHHTFEKP